MEEVSLRPVTEADLPIFFEQQLDEDANYMAAFVREEPADREGFMAHWAKITADPTIKIRTIIFNEEVAGNVSCHRWFGEPEVSYWLGKEYWGKGIATQALRLFLEVVQVRPLYGRVAYDNLASLRVLEKCGFVVVGRDRGFAQARGQEIEELILKVT